MKKLIFMITAIFAIAFFIGCDPIEDAENETRYLVFKGEKGDVGPRGPRGDSCSAVEIKDTQGEVIGISIQCGFQEPVEIYNGKNGTSSTITTSVSKLDNNKGYLIIFYSNSLEIGRLEVLNGENGTCTDCCSKVSILDICDSKNIIIKIQNGDSVQYFTDAVVSMSEGMDNEMKEIYEDTPYLYYQIIYRTILKGEKYFKINSATGSIECWCENKTCCNVCNMQ